MPFLKQSTTKTVRIGPFLDISDGVTQEEALTLTGGALGDFRISKNGAAFQDKNDASGGTHDSDGWYSTSLNATDTDTVGELIMHVQQPANALPVWARWWVLEEDIYDSLFAASAQGFDPNQRVDVGEWGGTAVAAITAGGRPHVDLRAISGNTAVMDPWLSALKTIVVGTVDTSVFTPTSGSGAQFETASIIEATVDHFKGRLVAFYDSGDALYRQFSDITASADQSGARTRFTVTDLTDAPASGDLFVIL